MTGRSIRERYVQTVDEEVSDSQYEAESDDGYAPYVAFARGSGQRKEEAIMVRYEDGLMSEVLFYNYLIRAFCTDDRHLTLTSTEGVYLIEGDNLTGLLEGIQDRKIRAIIGFNRAIHTPPAANAPMIYGIEYLTNEDFYALVSKRDAVRPPE